MNMKDNSTLSNMRLASILMGLAMAKMGKTGVMKVYLLKKIINPTPIQPAFLVIPCSNLEHVHRNTWKILTRKAVSFAPSFLIAGSAGLNLCQLFLDYF